jgi:glycosyltransferase involved in cell wall biosynthesis
MACGLPVVASRLPGATDHVEHDVTGLLVPPQDVAAMTTALGRIIDDPDWRRDLGRRAREAAAARFDLRQTSKRVLDAYYHVEKL